MAMAQSVAALIESSLRHANGLRVRCVIADTCIGGVAEAAMAAEKFRKAGVGVSLTVTPCWCYGSETMDMDPHVPKAVWGFNGTERPGAVYLAAVSAAHNQKGLPAFTIYGRDVQDKGDAVHPRRRAGEDPGFVGRGLAVATMRGKSYLSVGGTSMGIAGSIVSQRSVRGLPRHARRVGGHDRDRAPHRSGHLRPAGVPRGLRLGAGELPRGRGLQPEEAIAKQKDAEWAFCVKSAMIVRDLMVGNPRLAALGFGEEALGHNAIASAVSRASASGPITTRTAISSKRSSTRRSTGPASASPSLSRRRTTA